MIQAAASLADRDSFLRDILAGLSQPHKALPCKYFYDERGGRLFEQICDLEEYYLPRCELALLHQHGPQLARIIGPGCVVIEYGSGDSPKTRLLLDQLSQPAFYVPVDVNRPQLEEVASRLSARYATLTVRPVAADFTQPFDLPALPASSARLVFFSGSTIGNFPPEDAVRLLEAMRRQAGPGGAVLVGVDLQKDPALLERAYDDAQGVTAAFNLNLLARINRELDGTFVLEQFRHRARYNRTLGRIEMHLVSQSEQTARIGDRVFSFARGEAICTEYAYKHTPTGFAALARRAGLTVQHTWTDEQGFYSLSCLREGGGREAWAGQTEEFQKSS